MMKATDQIIGPSRGDAATAKASMRQRGAKQPDMVDRAIDEIYRLCAPDDMPDAAIVTAAEDVETGTYTNEWSINRFNFGSLGVTGDTAQNAASPTFKTPELGAKAHVAHTILYATGAIDRGGLTSADDPRYLAYRDAYGTTATPTLQGLAGRYAADPFYAATICQRAEVIFGAIPDQSTFTTADETPAGGTNGMPCLGGVVARG